MDRLKDALEEINNMDFDTGRADLLGLRVKEVIRRAFHPDEPCPQCKGVGEVSRIRTPDCGNCKYYSTTGPYSGECHKGHHIQDETDSVCSTDFVDNFPMEICPSCRGIKIIKEEEEDNYKDDDRFELLDIREKE